jgi:hypothetical protein
VPFACFQIVFFQGKNKADKEKYEQVVYKMVQDTFFKLNLASDPEKHKA